MDWYLENESRLNGQPKKTIGDYVEQNGILVPRRFDSLNKARNSGLPVIVRSEHPQDYDGCSGLLDSPKLEKFPEIQSEIELKEAILAMKYENPGSGEKLVARYCNYLRLDPIKFKSEISYSFWERIEGHNLKVVADSAIPSRYHITSDNCCGKNGEVSYNVWDKIIGLISTVGKTPETLNFDSLIEDYEFIRNLPYFDGSNCPLMEFQHSKGKNYFLQYMRTASLSPSIFTINREPVDGEIEAYFVRGATPPEGLTIRANAYYGSMGEMNLTQFTEDASFDFHWDRPFTEIMTRKRKIQCMHTKNWLKGELVKIAVGHNEASKLFKPSVSVFFNIGEVATEKEVEEIFERSEANNSAEGLYLHVVSDGSKAYIRRTQ